jgi:serine/threonine protein kinase
MMRYQLVETKEEGYNSTVIMARDVIMNVRVAIKVVESREMACGEIEALSIMGHPNMMHLIDCYEMVDAEGYALVMPVVDMNLSEFMCTDLFDETRMKDIMSQMGRAMYHMHNRRLLHCDIKPHNMGVILPRGNRNVVCKLLDLGSAKRFDDIVRGTVIQCTQPFVPPEMRRGIITSAGDVWQMGVTYKMMELKVFHSNAFSQLSELMTDDNMEKRPTSRGVMMALGQYTEPISVKHPLWEHPLLNICNDKSILIHDDSTSAIQRIVTLLQHDIRADDIECAFWMLLEASCKEVDDYASGASGGVSVLSCLHFFHARINFGTLNKLFYCKALSRLSTLPYFVLSDDMKLHLNNLSGYAICERHVLRILARGSNDSLLRWCIGAQNAGWGKKREPFVAFLKRFQQDWDTDSVDAAALALANLHAMGVVL